MDAAFFIPSGGYHAQYWSHMTINLQESHSLFVLFALLSHRISRAGFHLLLRSILVPSSLSEDGIFSTRSLRNRPVLSCATDPRLRNPCNQQFYLSTSIETFP